MLRVMMKSKIHRATITQADMHYEGSLTISAELMRAADILPYEMVHVYNISNGERFETYAIAGEAETGYTLCEKCHRLRRPLHPGLSKAGP